MTTFWDIMQNFRMLFFVWFLLFFVFPDIAHSAVRFSQLTNFRKLKGSLLKSQSDGHTAVFDPTRVTQLSWRPRAFSYRNFLTDEECDHLINLASGKLEKSLVVDIESGKGVESKVRTSRGMFLSKSQDDIVSGIEARIAAWTFLPKENGESMQILHYERGQKYEPHFDFFADKINIDLGGHRMATVLMYLSNVENGGETIFPGSEATQVKGEDWSECARNGYAVKPMKGDALLFFSLHPNATTDSSSFHGSCPVIKGDKWSATMWIHVKAYDLPSRSEAECIDENEDCPAWASVGECQNNPDYMVGSKSKGFIGFCRKSCKACKL